MVPVDRDSFFCKCIPASRNHTGEQLIMRWQQIIAKIIEKSHVKSEWAILCSYIFQGDLKLGCIDLKHCSIFVYVIRCSSVQSWNSVLSLYSVVCIRLYRFGTVFYLCMVIRCCSVWIWNSVLSLYTVYKVSIHVYVDTDTKDPTQIVHVFSTRQVANLLCVLRTHTI